MDGREVIFSLRANKPLPAYHCGCGILGLLATLVNLDVLRIPPLQ